MKYNKLGSTRLQSYETARCQGQVQFVVYSLGVYAEQIVYNLIIFYFVNIR
jgi:hypothetical protein